MESRPTSIVGVKEDMKEEVVRLGVELSLNVAQSMFLLCDDIRTMLWFCFKIRRDANMVATNGTHVMDRLLCVMQYVYTKYIKPKNGAYRIDGNNSVQWRLIWPTHLNFAHGFVFLDRLVHVLQSGGTCGREFTSPVEQEVKKIVETLGCAKGDSEANGFAWDEMESDILDMWRSLYDTEAKEATPTQIDLFLPLYHELEKESRLTSIVLRPIRPWAGSRTVSGKEDMKDEAVRLGVELSLHVAQSMFVLCDDIRTMLWFCFKLWRDANMGATNDTHVMDRLLCVMHYVYTKYIKPKYGVYQNDGNSSVQVGLIWLTHGNFAHGFVFLNRLVHVLRSGGTCDREFTSLVKEEVKKVEEKLGCAKSVSEANGFAWNDMESDILDIWKSLCDTEAKEATPTLKTIKTDLFLPIYNEAYPPKRLVSRR
ncbi:unnamed protein product [Thlaspi arvense]|uniref:Uncharacterized protein n=1 Tax=Thlaspi arvense TaxID=13288 RepID=A0AAU9SYL1_THLAR|nr:unnamed protein product [Thlaspi arvense]